MEHKHMARKIIKIARAAEKCIYILVFSCIMGSEIIGTTRR